MHIHNYIHWSSDESYKAIIVRGHLVIDGPLLPETLAFTGIIRLINSVMGVYLKGAR